MDDDADWLKRCMRTEYEGTPQTGRPRKTWWNCVKADMESLACPVRMLRMVIIGD